MENFSRKDNKKIVSSDDPKIQLLNNLDKFIQECLDKYKPKENPDESLYANTSEKQRDLIISKKSTIPDLVIWNKVFNKNECFVGADTNIDNNFPRFTFYLRLNKDKNGKGKSKNAKNKEKKNKKNKKKKKQDNNVINNEEEDTKETIGINNIMLDDLTNDMNKLSLNIDNINRININNENKKEKKKKNKQKMPKPNNNNEPQNKFNDYNLPINPSQNMNLNFELDSFEYYYNH